MDVPYAPVLDLAGNGVSDGGAALTLDDPQRQVEPGGHTRRGEQVAVVHDAPSTSWASVARRSSSASWWVVTRRPLVSPAAASSIAPVHTDAT